MLTAQRRQQLVQPAGAVRLRRGHPLAQDLAILLPLSSRADMEELVSGRRAVPTGQLALINTAFGRAPLFGTGNYVDFPQPDSITTATQPVTFAWLQEPRATTGYSTLLTWRPVGAISPFLIYHSASDSSYYFTVGPRAGSGVPSFSSQVGPATNGQPDRFVLVCSAGLGSLTPGDYVLYRNGQRITTSALSSFGSSTATVARIGATEAGGDPWEGGITAMHIWARSLSQAEAIAWSAAPYQLLEDDRHAIMIAAAAAPSTGRVAAMAATETGADTAAGSAAVQVQATASCTEAGADSAAGSAAVTAQASMSASEVGQDAASASAAATVQASLAAVETGADVLAGNVGAALPTLIASMAATESGADAAAATAAAQVQASMAAVEQGLDTAAGSVVASSSITATMAATEAGTDAASAAAFVQVQALMAIAEAAVLDGFAAVAQVLAQAQLAAVEAGADRFAGVGSSTGIKPLEPTPGYLVAYEPATFEVAAEAQLPAWSASWSNE